MLVSTLTTLALRCPDCGRLDFYGLSRFSLSGGKKARINCECGAPILYISAKGRNTYYLQIACLMCDAKHLLTFSGSEIWGDKVLTLVCANTGIEIGFAGPREAVVQSVKRLEGTITGVTENPDFDKYFQNPEVMYQVLEILNNMSEEGKLSCGCGASQLDVEAYPDRVELNCQYCGSAGVVPAETVKDLENLRRTGEISLDSGCRYSEEKHLRNRRPVKK